jgi:hypothetical protein
MGFAHGPGSTPGGAQDGNTGDLTVNTLFSKGNIGVGGANLAGANLILTAGGDVQARNCQLDQNLIFTAAGGNPVIQAAGGQININKGTFTGNVSAATLSSTGGITLGGALTSSAGGAAFAGTNGVQIDAETGTVGAQTSLSLVAGNGTVFLSSIDAADPVVPTVPGTLSIATSGKVSGGTNAGTIVCAANQNSVGWLAVCLSLNGAGAPVKYYIPLFNSV